MLTRLLFAILISSLCLCATQASAQQAVPGQMMTNPLVLPNPVQFTGGPATITGNGQATLGGGTTIGAILTGQGSTSDVTIKNHTGSNICTVATGTTVLNCVSFSANGTALTFPPSGLLTGTTDAQTLTNKTLTLPTISGAALSGTLSGSPTISGQPTWSLIQNFGAGFRDCSGHQWIDITCPAYGAVSDGATNNVTAIANAITAAGPGGVVYFPSGGTGFCAWPISGSTTFTITQQSLTLQFQSATTVLSTCGHDATLIALEGNDDQINNGVLSCFGSPDDPKFGSYGFSSPTHDCLVLEDNSTISQCSACILQNVTVHGGFNAIRNMASAVEMYGVYAGFNYGNGIYYSTVDPIGGTGGSVFAFAGFFDNNYPGACGGPAVGQTAVSAWQASHSYSTACTVVTIGSGAYNVQNLSACTSGSGSAPSVKFYRQNITDNTCTWQLTNPVSLNGIVLDTGSHENYFDNQDITGATTNSILAENSGAGTAPSLFFCRHCLTSLSVGSAVSLTAGSDIHFTDSSIGAGFTSTSSGIVTSSAFNTGGSVVGLQVVGGTVGGSTWGLNLTAGHNNTIAGANIQGGSSGGVSLSIGFTTITGNTFIGASTGSMISFTGTPASVVCFGNNSTGTFSSVVSGAPSSGNCSNTNNS